MLRSCVVSIKAMPAVMNRGRGSRVQGGTEHRNWRRKAHRGPTELGAGGACAQSCVKFENCNTSDLRQVTSGLLLRGNEVQPQSIVRDKWNCERQEHWVVTRWQVPARAQQVLKALLWSLSATCSYFVFRLTSVPSKLKAARDPWLTLSSTWWCFTELEQFCHSTCSLRSCTHPALGPSSRTSRDENE